MSHWLIDALQEGLESIEHSELVRLAMLHANAPGEWAPRKVRPSLIAEECRLARIKKFRGHDPQPGVPGNGAMKGGRPSAGTAIHFYRGYVAEGMAVTALNRVSRSYQTLDELRSADGRGGGATQVTHQGLGRYPFDVLGCSPWMLFEHRQPSESMGHGWIDIPYQAHPDMVIATDQGIELVQVKCPSMWAFQRYQKDGGASIRKRYEPQAIAEMAIGRLMGLPIQRNHILVFALEGALPGSDAAKDGQEILSEVVTVEWEDGHDRFVEAIAEEILEDDARAGRGEWPVAYPLGTRWPCDYCLYPRAEMTSCEENERWELEPQRAVRSSFLPTGSPAIPSLSPSSSTMDPAKTTPTGPGSTARERSLEPPPLPSLTPMPTLPPLLPSKGR